MKAYALHYRLSPRCLEVVNMAKVANFALCHHRHMFVLAKRIMCTWLLMFHSSALKEYALCEIAVIVQSCVAK